jgi:hypothetical protein
MTTLRLRRARISVLNNRLRSYNLATRLQRTPRLRRSIGRNPRCENGLATESRCLLRFGRNDCKKIAYAKLLVMRIAGE